MKRLSLAGTCFLTLLLAGCTETAAPPPATEKPVAIHNTLRWKTASEFENYGFDVYRSTSEDGSFETINDQPVAGAGTVDVPQHYEYIDYDIQPDTAYFYYVESISLEGERQAITPVFRAPPKPAAE